MIGHDVSWGGLPSYASCTRRVNVFETRNAVVAESTRFMAHLPDCGSHWHWPDQNTPSTFTLHSWASERGRVCTVVSMQADNSDSAHWPDLLITCHRSHTSSKHNSKIDHTFNLAILSGILLLQFIVSSHGGKHSWGCLATNNLRIYLHLISAKQRTPKEKCITGKCTICTSIAHKIRTQVRQHGQNTWHA